MYRLARKELPIKKILIIGIIVFFIYIPFHPFFTAWVGSLTEVYAPVKVWKDIVIGALTILLVAYSLVKPNLRSVVWRDAINILILGYAVLHFLLLAIYGSFLTESAIAGLIFNLRFLALFISLRVILAIFPDLKEKVGKPALKIVFVGAVIVGVIALLQVIFPTQGIYEYLGYDGVNTIAPATYVDDNPNAPRAFSTLRGPNELGSYMILPLVAAIALLMSGKRKWYIIGSLVVFIGAILASHSRSALIGAVVAVGVISVLYLGKRISKKMQLLTGITALLMIPVVIWASISIPQVRLFVFHSSPGDPTLFEGSTEDHFKATGVGVADAIEHPFGRGPGEAGPASFYQTDEPARIPENYFVQIAQEVGLLGLGVFLIILVLVGKRLLESDRNLVSSALVASLVGLSTVSLFLHTWADDPTSYVWWGLAALVMGYNDGTSWKKSKDSSRSKTSSSS